MIEFLTKLRESVPQLPNFYGLDYVVLMCDNGTNEAYEQTQRACLEAAVAVVTTKYHVVV